MTEDLTNALDAIYRHARSVDALDVLLDATADSLGDHAPASLAWRLGWLHGVAEEAGMTVRGLLDDYGIDPAERYGERTPNPKGKVPRARG